MRYALYKISVKQTLDHILILQFHSSMFHMQVPYWLTYDFPHLKSVESLNISGDQTGRVKHRSGEHMIQPYIVRCGIYGEGLQLSPD